MPLRCSIASCRRKPYKREVSYTYNSFEDDDPTVKTVRRYCCQHALLVFKMRRQTKVIKHKWTPLFDKSGNVVSNTKDGTVQSKRTNNTPSARSTS